MRTALLVALAAALLLPAPRLAVAQPIGVGSAGAGRAPPSSYLPDEAADGCPEIFQRHDEPAPAEKGLGANLNLKTWPCQNFKFHALVDVTADMEEDRLLVLPRMTSLLPACYIANLIRSVEALPRGRFLELRFENVSVYDVLLLDDIDVLPRLTFVNVDFIPAALGRAATEQSLPPVCRYRPTPGINLENTSIFTRRAHFTQPVVFENVHFGGDFISIRTTFANRLDVIDSDVRGDFVLESTDFAVDLVLGQENTFREQIVLDGVRVRGDLRLDDAELIDTYLQPTDTVHLLRLAEEQLRPTLEEQLRTTLANEQLLGSEQLLEISPARGRLRLYSERPLIPWRLEQTERRPANTRARTGDGQGLLVLGQFTSVPTFERLPSCPDRDERCRR